MCTLYKQSTPPPPPVISVPLLLFLFQNTGMSPKINDNVSSLFSKIDLRQELAKHIFPNMEIMFSIVITNCSGERSFYVLQRVKKHLRNPLSHCKLNTLSVMAVVESDITESIDFLRNNNFC